jgi:hypothetical protein
MLVKHSTPATHFQEKYTQLGSPQSAWSRPMCREYSTPLSFQALPGLKET